MSVGSKITEYRRKTGITSRDLAAILSITPATMSRYENGKIRSIPSETLGKIASALNCSVSDLIQDDSNYDFLKDEKIRKRKSSFRTQEEEHLLKGYRGLSQELQAAVRQICKTGISDEPSNRH